VITCIKENSGMAKYNGFMKNLIFK